MSDIAKVHEHIDSMKEQDIQTLMDLVRIPSVAAQGNSEGVRHCAEVLCEMFRKLDFQPQIFETPTQPVVFAERKSKTNPNGKTILFYGHYDVQPAEPLAPWKTPPYEPTIINGRMYGRGTADNKGQFLGHMLAARSFLEITGDIPLNVKIILDGEEENGSPSLPDFFRQHFDLLKNDLIYFSDGPMQAGGVPEIKHGLRGLVTMEISLRTAEHGNHSGRAGGIIRNAATEIAHLISSMVDPDGHIKVEGIYDDVVPATDFEKELISKIPYDPDKLAKVYSTPVIKANREEFYKQFNFLPSLTISGINSGYTGEGTKASVPEYAYFKADLRMVKKMDPEDIKAKIRAHVAKHCPDAKVTFFDAFPAGKSDPGEPICRATHDAVKAIFPTAVVIPTSAGSGPGWVFTDLLKAPMIMVPYGNVDQTNHAANENLDLECYNKGIHCSAEVMERLSKL